MLRIILCFVYNIFTHEVTNGRIFEKKKIIENKMRVWFSLQIVSETFLILRRTERDMMTYVYESACKVPVILVRF